MVEKETSWRRTIFHTNFVPTHVMLVVPTTSTNKVYTGMSKLILCVLHVCHAK